jgi:hypothetical protein
MNPGLPLFPYGACDAGLLICSYCRCVIVVVALHTAEGASWTGDLSKARHPGNIEPGTGRDLPDLAAAAPCCATLVFTLYCHSGWASPSFIETVQDVLAVRSD